MRTVPGGGRVIVNAAEPRLAEVIDRGCWTPQERFSARAGVAADWSATLEAGDGSAFRVHLGGKPVARVEWPVIGLHNVDNALAAMAAARHVGVPPEAAAAALGQFRGVKRRMEVRGEVAGITVYDDFAHHPTAVRTTLDGLRRRVGAARIVAVLEPRSATMKRGVHRDELAGSLAGADRVWLYQPEDLGWDLEAVARPLGAKASVARDIAALAGSLAGELREGDHVLIMSNGGFGGLHERLLAGLRGRSAG